MAYQAATSATGRSPQGPQTTVRPGDQDLVWAALIVIFVACFVIAVITLNP